jgi:DNA-binding CsgD family transcriptional regulator
VKRQTQDTLNLLAIALPVFPMQEVIQDLSRWSLAADLEMASRSFHQLLLESAVAAWKAASKEAIESLPRSLEKTLAEFHARIHSDPLIVNILRAADSRASKRSRLRAATAIARLTKAGIASQRWATVVSELRKLAEQHRRPSKKELKLLTTSAIFIALDAANDLSITDKQGISKAIQRRVNDLVTQDILGLEWRRRSKPDPPTGQERPSPSALREVPSDLREIETRLDVSRLIHKADLSDREAELMGLLRRDEDISRAARTMGIKASTARVLKSTALKKIRVLKKS